MLKLVFRTSCLLISCSLFFSTSGFAAEPVDLKASWKDGIRIESEDQAIKIRFGGRLMLDGSSFVSSDEELEEKVGDLDAGSEVRRARLSVSGELYEMLEFKGEYDFAGGESEIKDVYIGLEKLPFGGLRFGHFKEPFSLEELTSANHITFLERSVANALAPSRNNGAMIYGALAEDRFTYATGLFREANDYGEEYGDDNAFASTSRLTALPLFSNEGRELIHLGAAYSFRNYNDSLTKIRQRPELHNSPYFLDTGDLNGDSSNLFGAEFAVVYGSFSVQAEYQQIIIDPVDQTSSLSFPGYYILASYFLTGEHRPYQKKNGAFDRVQPLSPYVAAQPGTGAWEIAARYSALDLNDSQVEGGELNDFTLGLNWYLHSNAKMMFAWVHADNDDYGEADILQGRMQVDF